MISFVDNWLQPFSLSASATEGALDLPQGIYVLTMADSSSAATRWEVLYAEVVDGQAVFQRPAPQEWPEGSVIYCAVNSVVMSAIFAEIVANAARIADLEGVASGPLTIIDELPSTGELPVSGAGGDAYLIAGNIWVWATGTGAWVDAGGYQGEQGDPGADGRASEFQASATHVQWRLVGDPSWIDLLPLSELAGADGVDGADGADGRNPEFQASATHLQYRLTGDTAWIDLLPLSSLQGPAGDDGADGREIELQTSATHIQKRYTGDPTWTDLIALSALKGDQGDAGADGADGADGVPVEFQASATHVQWRLVGSATWIDLVPLSEIGVSTGGGFTGGTLSSALNEAPAVTIASAATVNIGAATANTIRITGTSAITAFDAIPDGAVRRLEFAGALTLTHNAVSLILPTSSNIVTVAGDVAEFRSLGGGNWRCTGYLRADGTPLAGGGGGGGLTYFVEAQNTASPNTTTPAVSLSVDVAETNADAVLAAKGIGATIAQVPDNNTTGGAKRGSRATDWQKGRNSSNQVASGAESTISGGANNTALGMGAVVGGGVANSVSPTYGVCGGGSSNTVSGTSGTIAGGSSNQINSGADGGCIPGGIGNRVFSGATAAAVLGGSGNTASGQYSTVLGGYQATSRGIYGAEVRASGQFSAQGDAQRGRYILRRSTTSATPLTLGADGAGGGITNQVVLPNNAAYAFTGRVVARENATGDCAAWEFRGVIRRGASAATTALVAAVTPEGIAADAGAAAWGLSITADTSNGALAITVTGEAAHTIRWVADVETVEVVG